MKGYPDAEVHGIAETIRALVDAQREVAVLKEIKLGCMETIKEDDEHIGKLQSDIKELADNLLCAGEVIKRTNPELGKAYKALANKHLKGEMK